jgi:hypothetical protein
MYTPWGKADYIKHITRGLTIVETESHGGIMISKGFAKRNLSRAAFKRGFLYDNYCCFEEDCAAYLVIWELPQYFPKNDRQEVLNSLSRWNADYLIETNVKPESKNYTFYLMNKKQEQLRKEQSSNFIISAEMTENKDITKVLTADNKTHYVKSNSYHLMGSRLNLLSYCQEI